LLSFQIERVLKLTQKPKRNIRDFMTEHYSRSERRRIHRARILAISLAAFAILSSALLAWTRSITLTEFQKMRGFKRIPAHQSTIHPSLRPGVNPARAGKS
jgi:hypothetical protein